MKKLLLILGALVLFGCAGQEALKHGQEMIEAGNEEQGLARLEEAMKANPNDVEIRNYYLRHKAVAVQRYLQMGENARAAGAYDQAEASYQRALRFDPRERERQGRPSGRGPRPRQRGAGQGSRRGDEARRYAGRAGEGAGSAEAPSDAARSARHRAQGRGAEGQGRH